MNLSNQQFDRVLDSCLTMLQQGETVESCLEKYPTWEKDLRPILELSSQVIEMPKPRATSAAVQSNRAKMMSALATQTEKASAKGDLSETVSFRDFLRYASQMNPFTSKKENFSTMNYLRFTTVMATLIIGFVVGNSVVKSSLPGDAFYQAKLLTEDTRELITADDRIEEIKKRHTQNRLDELTAMQARNRSGSITIDGPITVVDEGTLLINGLEIDPADYSVELSTVQQAASLEITFEDGQILTTAFNEPIGPILIENSGGESQTAEFGSAEIDTGFENTPIQSDTPTALTSSTGLGGFVYNNETLESMSDIGMTWVTYQVKWSGTNDLSNIENLVQTGRSNGLNVLLKIDGTSSYPSSIDFGGYVQFLSDVASLPDPPDAISIWSEMNIDFNWPSGQINPQTYVDNMLAPAYGAIKQANPSIAVISGAPAPTGFFGGQCTNTGCDDDAYLRGMAEAGASQFIDCVGVHYNAGATSPTATSGHPADGDSGHYSWYFGSMVDTYSSAFNDEVPLCFTEIGYLSSEGFDTISSRFSWSNGTSLVDQAAWIAEAYAIAKDDPRIQLFNVFNIDSTFYDSDGDPQAGFALIRPDGSCPACETLKAVSEQ